MDLRDHVIRDFTEVFWLFEAGRAVEVTWVKWPVARASTSFRRLMSTSAGRSAFCVFNGLLRLVARGRTDGLLVVKGEPITVEDVVVETGIPAKDVRAGLEALKHKDIAWIITDAEQAKLRETRTTNGRQTGKNRAADGSKPDGVRNPLAGARSHSLSTSDSSSLSPEGVQGKPTAADFAKPPPGLQGAWSHFELEQITAHYPKRCKSIRAREAASRACVALVQRGVEDPIEWLAERVKAYAAAVAQWPKAERQWVPDPHNWFDAGSYDDDPATWVRRADVDGKPAPKPTIPAHILDRRRKVRQWLRNNGENERRSIVEFRAAHPGSELDDSQVLQSPIFQDWVWERVFTTQGVA